MRRAETIEGLIHERGRKGLPLERVYRLLFNPDLYTDAYSKLYRTLTAGATPEMDTVQKIIKAVRDEKYQWHHHRSDKVLQEVMRKILHAYYEPQFSEHAHGFRPGRGCHTALREITYQWAGTNWFIEGDISRCFDALDHKVMIATLQEKIHDGRLIQLVRNLLEAGYLEDWQFNDTLSGCPQGGIISPLLANIYLDKLDKFVETELIPAYTRGARRAANAELTALNWQALHLHQEGEKADTRTVKHKAQQRAPQDSHDPNFRRLRYVRYANDFLLGYIGSGEEASEIKQKIGEFLQEQLNLELSKTRTLITHARKGTARFLGYEVYAPQKNAHRRMINRRMRLRIPEDVLKKKCQQYMEQGKARYRAELLLETDFMIIEVYQAEYREFVDHYKFAHNLHSLHKLKWIMKQSLMKTLASKFKMSVKKLYKQYRTDFLVEYL